MFEKIVPKGKSTLQVILLTTEESKTTLLIISHTNATKLLNLLIKNQCWIKNKQNFIIIY